MNTIDHAPSLLDRCLQCVLPEGISVVYVEIRKRVSVLYVLSAGSWHIHDESLSLTVETDLIARLCTHSQTLLWSMTSVHIALHWTTDTRDRGSKHL